MRWPPLHTPLLIPPPHPASHKWGHGAWDGSSLEGGPSCSGRTRQPAKDLVELKGWWIYIATYTENERTLLPLLVIAAAVPHPPVRVRSLLPKAGLLLLATTPRCRQTRARAHRDTHTHTLLKTAPTTRPKDEGVSPPRGGGGHLHIDPSPPSPPPTVIQTRAGG